MERGWRSPWIGRECRGGLWALIKSVCVEWRPRPEVWEGGSVDTERGLSIRLEPTVPRTAGFIPPCALIF